LLRVDQHELHPLAQVRRDVVDVGLAAARDDQPVDAGEVGLTTVRGG
jgi:hypothetical protein